MPKAEDPIIRLIRQQREQEREVGAAVKAPYAKQRDSGDPSFNDQGPSIYRGGTLGYGTKDRMPGTTPNPEFNIINRFLELLRIRKRQPNLKIKTKDRDLI